MQAAICVLHIKEGFRQGARRHTSRDAELDVICHEACDRNVMGNGWDHADRRRQRGRSR